MGRYNTKRSGPPLVVCEQVSKVFKSALGQESLALTDVSLSIFSGEFVCLLGPSGCGKTTLLNLVAGFIQPTSGNLLVGGDRVVGPGSDRGVVFQDYSLFGWLTVRKNVEFGLRMAGVGADQRREIAARYLKLVGLIDIENKYPFELSGGMKQRVAIARALVANPKLLLMDEPFAALDAITRGTLQELVLAIREKEDKTIVFVTHNIGEAIYLADRIVVMTSHPGRVQAEVIVALPRPRSRADAGFSAIYEQLEEAIGAHTVD